MSSSKNKMYDYEVTPPASVWDRVAAALDESALDHQFPKKLYDATAEPPAGLWNKIAPALLAAEASTDAESSPVIPVGRKSISWMRYAAAAVLVIALGITTYQLTRPGKAEDALAAGESKQTTLPTDSAAGNDESNPARPPADEAQVTTASTGRVNSQESQNTIRRTEQQAAFRQANYADVPAPQFSSISRSRQQTEEWKTNPLYAYEDHVPDLSDRYILLMTPDGNLIRMSKKLGDMVCCVAGEEQDDDCKSKLKKWQQKLAEMPVAPSPGNFLDILTMVSSLDGTNL